MAEPINPGALRSKINLSLHTTHATRIWWGRGVDSGKPQIVGMRQYLALAGRIQQAATADDPYADQWMLTIDERIKTVQHILDPLYLRTREILDTIPAELSVADNMSMKPFTTGVYPGGQQGWQGIHALIQYDRIARNILLCRHIALITHAQSEDLFQVAGRAIRSLCGCTRRYPGPSGATRDDFAANNARAQAAQQRLGVLPAEILEGKKRSPYAPPVRKPQAQPTPAETQQAEAELQQQETLEHQASKPEEKMDDD